MNPPLPPVTPRRCAGCGQWHDVLGAVIWGDAVGHLCSACIAYYRQLRMRPESLHLHWAPPLEALL